MIGIVVNPKTKEPLIVEPYAIGSHYFYYKLWTIEDYLLKDNKSLNISEVASGKLSKPSTKSIHCHEIRDIPSYVSGYPRVDSMVAKDLIGRGYGTAIYAAATVSSIQFDETLQGGISSSKESRTHLANQWWDNMYNNDLSDRTVYNFTCINPSTKQVENKSIEIDTMSLNDFIDMKTIIAYTDRENNIRFFDQKSCSQAKWSNLGSFVIEEFIEKILKITSSNNKHKNELINYLTSFIGK
mgnify:CR=1 FL=1